MKNKKEVFNGFPNAEFSNSMTTTKKGFSIIFRPNNYRRQIKVKLKTNSTIENSIKVLSSLRFLWNLNKHTKIISIKYNNNITLQYAKETLIGIYSQEKINNNKITYFIEADTIDLLEKRIDQIRGDIKEKIDKALIDVARRLNIYDPYKKIIWTRHEDFIKGEEFIDNIPREVIIHDTTFKKVYGSGLEMFGTKEQPNVKIKNYIKNRALENIAPEIADGLNKVTEAINTFSKTLEPTIEDLNLNMKSHLSAVKNIDRSFKRFNKLLSQRTLKDWLK